MFMRPTDFSPQITYNDQLLGGPDPGFMTRAKRALRSRKRLTRGEARAQFFNWLQNRNPKMADKVFGYGAGTLEGMGADNPFLPSYLQPYATPPIKADTRTEYVTVSKPKPATVAAAAVKPAADVPWYEKMTSGLPGAVTAYTQYKLTKMNLDRAKKGLPPIDSAAYAPTVRVQAEVDPQLKTALFIGGGVIVAAALFAALK